MNRKERRRKARAARQARSRPGAAAAAAEEALATARRLIEAGELAESEAVLGQLLRAQADSPAAHYLLGLVKHGRGMFEIAVEHLSRAVALDASSAEYRNTLGVALVAAGRGDEAIPHFEAAVALSPDHALAYKNLGVALKHRGKWLKALLALDKALSLRPDYLAAHDSLVSLLGEISPEGYWPQVSEAIERCLSSPFAYHANLARPSAAQIRLKYNIARSNDPLADLDWSDQVIDELDADDFFLSVLESTINADHVLEIFLTQLRRRLLFTFGVGGDAEAAPVRLISAMARQCFNNEYVFSIRDDERQRFWRIEELIRRDPGAGASSPASQLRLLVYAMYQPLSALSCGEALLAAPQESWMPELKPLVELTLADHAKEQRLREEIGSLGEIADATSIAVREQYEENPYPRWLQVPRRPPMAIGKEFHRRFPHFHPPVFLSGHVSILVAGCGTGWHPINIALLYENCSVLAVDLSKSSLSYAKRMANKLGVANIKFLQADILNLERLDREFDLIECIGVLHHMRNPIDGWRILAGRLRSGGLFKVGLYSRKSRQLIVEVRDHVRSLGLEPTIDGIRSFRRNLLREGETGAFARLLVEPDFFSVSTCRDLIFHAQEQQLTLAQIKAMIEVHDMTFIGFDLGDSGVTALYRSHFPADTTLTDLMAWDSFEDLYPGLVSGYDFWCQKA